MTLDEPIPEGFIQNIVTEVYENSKTPPKIQVKNGANIGEGFLGITCSVQVKIGEEIKHLFIKMLPQSKPLRKALFMEKVFQREASFYLELRPILNEIFMKYLKKKFDITPECVLVKEESFNETLIFENVAIQGYATVKEKIPLTKEHILLALKTYSYLHASGFVFKRDRPQEFEEILKRQPSIFFQVLKQFENIKIVNFGLDILKQFCNENDKVILEKFNDIRNEIQNVEGYLNNIEDYSTIVHIDCWKNNLMFKYNKNVELEDMKLVDMQMWTINSPVFDIFHVVCANISEDGSPEELDAYFQHYYELLTKAISEMNGDPNILYPREIFELHLRKYCFYGFYMSCSVQRALYADPKDLPNIVQMIANNKSLGNAFIYKLPDEESYAKRLKIILKYLLKIKTI